MVTGDPRILVCGLPAARKGDVVLDPLGVLQIVSFSSTVSVGGLLAARFGDQAAPSASRSGKGVPAVVQPGAPPKKFNLTTDRKDRTAEEAMADDLAVGPHLEGSLKDTNGDGIYDMGTLEGALFRLQAEKKVDPNSGKPELGGKVDFSVFGVKTKAHGLGPYDGMGGTLQAEGSMESVEVGGFASDGHGSMLGLGAGGQLFHGKAGGESWAGYNASTGEYGFRTSGGLKGEVLTGELKGTAQTPLVTAILPFVPPSMARHVPWIGDINVGVDAGVGGDLVAGGASGGVEATYNPAKKRGQLGLSGELALLLGLKFDLVVYFEKVEKKADVPQPGPTVIITGAPTVLIGD